MTSRGTQTDLRDAQTTGTSVADSESLVKVCSRGGVTSEVIVVLRSVLCSSPVVEYMLNSSLAKGATQTVTINHCKEAVELFIYLLNSMKQGDKWLKAAVSSVVCEDGGFELPETNPLSGLALLAMAEYYQVDMLVNTLLYELFAAPDRWSFAVACFVLRLKPTAHTMPAFPSEKIMSKLMAQIEEATKPHTDDDSDDDSDWGSGGAGAANTTTDTNTTPTWKHYCKQLPSDFVADLLEFAGKTTHSLKQQIPTPAVADSESDWTAPHHPITHHPAGRPRYGSYRPWVTPPTGPWAGGNGGWGSAWGAGGNGGGGYGYGGSAAAGGGGGWTRRNRRNGGR
ncbi:unnamed protein product [Vitrella brassicaformis CCMP3155]|uniref:BTB domain-containing protein n=1 Tax=Vitrella brassicaformis (strain CCMP3155) TaxID=1169540 RepID=A0A0G4H668_VITBC|nr:unnamed protein product [Vitrella brassicaformis CCMP3155]|eukprot:CEM39325.1 unnamed protein product [Vitrella brassicaformis CCMP3155]